MSAKKFLLYILAVIVLFALVTLLKGWINPFVIPLWIGGLIGVFLPEIDHLVYAYFLRPHEYDSQRIQRMINQGQVVQSLQMGEEARVNNKNLVFHTVYFQIIFILFALFVVTSTNSLLGRGIVLGFLINLLIDQYLDLKMYPTLDNWFNQIKINLTQERASLYVLGNAIAIVILALIF